MHRCRNNRDPVAFSIDNIVGFEKWLRFGSNHRKPQVWEVKAMNVSEQLRFEFVVIGGGPAGVSGAIAAGILGKRVALIEKEAVVGGAGINTGTIPSKTLRETALVLSGGRSRRLFGVDLSLRREATIADFMCHEKQVKSQERKRSEGQLALRGVNTFHGSASFVDPHTIRVVSGDGVETRVYGDKILIATGSSPLRPAEFHFEDDRIHDSNEILELKALPKKLVVIGAGVIGCEYAGTFAARP